MPHPHKGMPVRSTGCLDYTKWRGSQLPESCQSLFRGWNVSKIVFLQHGPPQYDIFSKIRCVGCIPNYFIFTCTQAYTKKARNKNKSCHVSGITDYLTVSTDTLWCLDHGSITPPKPHTHALEAIVFIQQLGSGVWYRIPELQQAGTEKEKLPEMFSSKFLSTKRS